MSTVVSAAGVFVAAGLGAFPPADDGAAVLSAEMGFPVEGTEGTDVFSLFLAPSAAILDALAATPGALASFATPVTAAAMGALASFAAPVTAAAGSAWADRTRSTSVSSTVETLPLTSRPAALRRSTSSWFVRPFSFAMS
ncbi:MAG: hypothetical protein LLG45_11255 [Actinomycetia bacterium]|nr:hypothetical protein [Actinomycetes bacterium]